ncbi:hypothetical protein QWY75_07490 [Pontixanthobacter aestiaquae]|uniref:Uncharacterized protein n=1 Tax=Pontixanthobacter aestiaquae TaxID=1509367 RepID=A0A844Z6L1_9SPHN|nr:hypothetical protein [Pontixanthobacter aestiaquae]MDN3646046.1 hypothetical protein [Pontixanthobacter aestiaquae]MXO82962.1 hypothetical protein [Pontixanthobacter aestiaquae]
MELHLEAALDLLTVCIALLACALWLRASRRKVRRISKHETLDYADFNRLVTAVNRTQILNAQAALATGAATALACVSLMVDFLLAHLSW